MRRPPTRRTGSGTGRRARSSGSRPCRGRWTCSSPETRGRVLTVEGGPFFESVKASVLSSSGSGPAETLAREVAAAAEGEVLGVIFFGSRRTAAARSDAHSAHDLFVLVRSYRGFYQALRRAGKTGKRPWLLAALNVVL